MAGGSLVVALLALAVDLLLGVIQRYAVSPGLTGRRTSASRRGRVDTPASTDRSNTPLDVEISDPRRTVDSQPS
jgi:osmoprotectant transport system permease protein